MQTKKFYFFIMAMTIGGGFCTKGTKKNGAFSNFGPSDRMYIVQNWQATGDKIPLEGKRASKRYTPLSQFSSKTTALSCPLSEKTLDAACGTQEEEAQPSLPEVILIPKGAWDKVEKFSDKENKEKDFVFAPGSENVSSEGDVSAKEMPYSSPPLTTGRECLKRLEKERNEVISRVMDMDQTICEISKKVKEVQTKITEYRKRGKAFSDLYKEENDDNILLMELWKMQRENLRGKKETLSKYFLLIEDQIKELNAKIDFENAAKF